MDNELTLNTEDFFNLKTYDINLNDIVLIATTKENISDEDTKIKEESVLYTGFKLYEGNKDEFKIKPETQKLFVRGNWYDMVDVYGMSMNPNT